MAFSKTLIVIFAVYSIILAFVYLIISSIFIASYFCLLVPYYERNEFAYLRYLVYHQSHHCDQHVNWELLGVQNVTNVQPERPLYRKAVIATLIIAISYLILNFILAATSLLVLMSVNHVAKHKIKSWMKLFGPFMIACIAMLTLDVSATTFYGYHFTQSMTIDGIMSTMQIKNRDAVRSNFMQIEPGNMTSPSGTMWFITAKFFMFLVLNLVVLLMFFSTSWEVIKENKRLKDISDRVFTQGLRTPS